MLTSFAGFELLITCLLLPYAAWLLGTGLRRLSPSRVAQAVMVAFVGLLPLGDSSNKPPVEVVGTLFLAFPLIAFTGLLWRPPSRKPKQIRQPVRSAAPLDIDAAGRRLSDALAILDPQVPAVAQKTGNWDFKPARQWEVSLRGAPNLLLRYQDEKNEITDREVRPTGVRGVWGSDDPRPKVIQAYCLMRRGARTFRVDRVVTAADAETGEIVDLREFIVRHGKKG